MFKPNLITILLCCSLVSGCAIVAIGTGIGLGAFAYVNGKLIKTYESDYSESIQASKDTLIDLSIPITEEISDELKHTINAQRTDETPIKIEIVELDRNRTEISVRTGSIGLWDKRVSEQIHNSINERLFQQTLHIGKQEKGSVKSEADSVGTIKNQKPPSIAKIQLNPDFIIYFDQNSNALSNEAIEKLNRIAEMVLRNPKAKIMLNGYSDSTGTASFNKMVSESRANSIKIYLVGKGINPSKIRSVGHGAKKLVSTDKSDAGRRLNRRVEIYLDYKPK
jgi:outer membrane protein OmpA-like peptidoglycan-associated protein